MFISTELYFSRLIHTLEHVIAPEIESDRVRGQVFAVIDLIQQLADRIEYKHELVMQDIEMGSDMIRRIVRAVEEAEGDAPEELRAFLKKLDEGSAGSGLVLRQKVEEMLCLAIDFFHDDRSRMEPAAAGEVDSQIRDYIWKITGRDLGLMKPPLLDQISRPKKGKS